MEVECVCEKIKMEKINMIVGPLDGGKTELLKNLINRFETKHKKIYHCLQNVQHSFLFDTVKEEVGYYIEYADIQNENWINFAQCQLDINCTFLERKIESLSLSEKRKLILYLGLIQKDVILFLDEPTLYLDENYKKKIIQLLKKANKNFSNTIIITTKDLSLAFYMAHEIFLFDRKLLFYGDKKCAYEHIDLLQQEGLEIPPTILFSYIVNAKKNIHLGYRMEIHDLIKDIYRNV